MTSFALRMFAPNENKYSTFFSKRYCLIPKYRTRHLKAKLVLGSVQLLKLQASEWSPCFKFSKTNLTFNSLKYTYPEQKYNKNAFKSHNSYVTQTILDLKHTKNST